jgi:hypothetical protein
MHAPLIAAILVTSLPAAAEPTSLQVDVLAGDARATGSLATSWTGGASVRLGLGARYGAFAGLVRLAYTPLDPSATNHDGADLAALVASADLEWFPRSGRTEPFVAIGVHDDGTYGFEPVSSNRAAMRVDPIGVGFEIGAGVQLTARSNATLAALRVELEYADGGIVTLGLGGELGANVSR